MDGESTSTSTVGLVIACFGASTRSGGPQNTVPQGAVTPTVYDNGALVFALIDQPADNALLGSMVTVTGAATSLGVATAPGAFQSWTLQLENSAGAMVQQIASGSTPVDFTVFATFTPTPGLPSGNYAVALLVDTVGVEMLNIRLRRARTQPVKLHASKMPGD